MKFGKHQRLLKSDDFKAIKGTRLKVSSPEILLLAKRNSLNYPRLGLAVAKRYVKLAVQRNLIKRIARESFRHNYERLSNLDIMLLVRSNIIKLNSKELRQCLEYLWKQLVKRAKQF